MAWAKRILLFLAVNFLIMITISLVMSIFHVQPYLSELGLNYQSLLIFCFIWGMVGSLISLALSKTMAKWMMGVKIVDVNTTDPTLKSLVNTIHRLARQSNLPPPEVGIYSSQDVNAFATGATKSGALVAVSTGLIQRMNQDELEGVLAHELAHIANGDMVTMALVQGVINAFVMFFARILAYVVSGLGRREGERGSYFSYMMLTFVFEIAFMILGSVVIAWFSRLREYRADSGGAHVAGKQKMIAALQALQKCRVVEDATTKQHAFQTMKISGRGSRLAGLFSTHPPLEKRIERLKTLMTG